MASTLPETIRRLRPARPAPAWAPEPPVALPEGRVVHVPGRGELFVRDSGGEGPPVLLLHGWTVSADLNWFTTYAPLIEAGYRVLALDHRGHGRGLRTPAPFRLADCAADAAALLRHLETGPALAVGYSMGGPIAQLMARDHPECVEGIVLCATAPDWQGDPTVRVLWKAMAGLRLGLGVFPQASWRVGLRLVGFPNSATTTWFSAELTRGSARDIAEAGRELGRYDARPWLSGLRVPAAVVVTTRDTGVPPAKQRELAGRLRAPVFEVDGDHAAVTVKSREFTRALLQALEAVRSGAARAAA
jgi:3-oxoadipate enol-lactonase